MNDYFEKIAEEAFNDELEKISKLYLTKSLPRKLKGMLKGLKAGSKEAGKAKDAIATAVKQSVAGGKEGYKAGRSIKERVADALDKLLTNKYVGI